MEGNYYLYTICIIAKCKLFMGLKFIKTVTQRFSKQKMLSNQCKEIDKRSSHIQKITEQISDTLLQFKIY